MIIVAAAIHINVVLRLFLRPPAAVAVLPAILILLPV
jgi:hypothetical protein